MPACIECQDPSYVSPVEGDGTTRHNLYRCHKCDILFAYEKEEETSAEKAADPVRPDVPAL